MSHNIGGILLIVKKKDVHTWKHLTKMGFHGFSISTDELEKHYGIVVGPGSPSEPDFKCLSTMY